MYATDAALKPKKKKKKGRKKRKRNVGISCCGLRIANPSNIHEAVGGGFPDLDQWVNDVALP